MALLIDVLKESFVLLFKHPVYFVPRLISITLWNFVYILLFKELNRFLSLTSTFSAAASGVADMSFLSLILALMVVFFPISVIVYSMYPVLTEDLKKGRRARLRRAFTKALSRFRVVLFAVLLPVLVGVILIIPFSFMLAFGLLMNDTLMIAVAIVGTSIIIFILSVLFYFTPASAVLTKFNVSEAVSQSLKLSKSHKRDVSIITVISFALFFAGLFSSTIFAGIGLTGFLVGRYLEGIIGTYNYVVNPKMYLEVAKPAKTSKKPRK